MFTQDFDIATIGAGLRGFLSQKTALIEDGAATTPSARTAGSRTSENSPVCHGQAPPAGFSDICPIRRRAVPTLASKRPTGDRRPSAAQSGCSAADKIKKLAGGFAPAMTGRPDTAEEISRQANSWHYLRRCRRSISGPLRRTSPWLDRCCANAGPNPCHPGPRSALSGSRRPAAGLTRSNRCSCA
jgi:hypothetical protein